MKKLLPKPTSLGVVALIFRSLLGTSEYSGAAAITHLLATLGGPFGMIGGIFMIIICSHVLEILLRIILRIGK